MGRFLNSLDRLLGGAISRNFREGAALVGTDSADEGKYRKLTSGTRDLSPMAYNKVVETAYYLWQRNPLAKRIVQIMKDFCIGDEMEVKIQIMQQGKDGLEDTDRTDAQDIWDRFATDPFNQFNTKLDGDIQDLFLSGELLMPCTVNDADGFVRLGFIDTTAISAVKEDKTGRFADTVDITRNGTTIPMKVIRPDIENTYGFVGEAFYFRINRVGAQTRGHSELVQLLDWIDGLDQFLFNNLEGSAFRNSFFYDMTVEGADEKKLKDYDATPPKSSTVKVHNEKVKWTVVTPDLKANDTAEASRMFKNLILAGVGFPEHWFADGGNTNLATAENMNIPTMRMLKKKQGEIQNIVKQIAEYVLFQAKSKGVLKLSDNEKCEITVTAFDFERKDSAVIASAFVQTVTALTAAKSNGWVSDESAKEVVDGMLGRLGVEVTESLEEIQADNDTEEMEQIYNTPKMLKVKGEVNS